MTAALEAFAAEVGETGPVAVTGGRTQWEVGGPLIDGARQVAAPRGVVAHEPGEMIVRVGAGTTLAELQDVVARGGQEVWLESPTPERATVGGLLAVGHNGPRRLGRGPFRDAVLEITAVDARGRLVRTGAPLVKNVTGFDLCRLLVGSLGTLALIGEVVLRCRPRSEIERWWVGEEVDPFAVEASLYRPLGVLWDGVRTWVGLAGYLVDVDEQARTVLGSRFQPADGPPVPPSTPDANRRSLPAAGLRSLPGRLGSSVDWLAEIGVGLVHLAAPADALPGAPVDRRVAALHRNLKERFDPTGRLNPGRSVIPAAA